MRWNSDRKFAKTAVVFSTEQMGARGEMTDRVAEGLCEQCTKSCYKEWIVFEGFLFCSRDCLDAFVREFGGNVVGDSVEITAERYRASQDPPATVETGDPTT
jgi:hypothetical protein